MIRAWQSKTMGRQAGWCQRSAVSANWSSGHHIRSGLYYNRDIDHDEDPQRISVIYRGRIFSDCRQHLPAGPVTVTVCGPLLYIKYFNTTLQNLHSIQNIHSWLWFSRLAFSIVSIRASSRPRDNYKGPRECTHGQPSSGWVGEFAGRISLGD